MTIAMNVEVAKTKKAAALVERSIQRQFKDVMQRATLHLLAGAKIEAPVKTGFLRNSITAVIGFPTSQVRADASYAQFVHDGTRRQRPNPFMLRARNNTVRWLRLQRIRPQK